MKLTGPTVAAVSLIMTLCASGHCATVFLEAESFASKGGWVVDQQFMDQMGSPFLLAHGLGTPIENASTEVEFPAPGQYRVWVRTRDWVAPWKGKGAPGRFQIHVAGKPLDATFGTEGAQWHWQDGGAVDVPKGRVSVALRDLTGFEGRCDAILFTTDASLVPPDEGSALAELRKRLLGMSDAPEDAGAFDLVVVGGGMAGTCAAVSAARLGLEVALVQDRPVLGGNNSSEIRVHLNGGTNLPPYPALGGVVRELDSGLRGNAQPATHYDDGKKLAVVRAEKNIHLFLGTHVFDAERQGEKIDAVIGKHIETGKELRFSAPVFADCTGDGTVGFLAGADYRMGREGRGETGEALAPEQADRMTMGASVQWYAVDAGAPVAFPECPWGERFTDATCHEGIHGDWDWETGMNQDQITDFEAIRDHGLRVAYGNWAFLKNHSRNKADYANHKLDWVAYIAGKRESRRLLGDVILQQQDIEERHAFPDACVTTTWTIDLHYPHPQNAKHFPGREFRSIAEQVKIAPYPIPFRCLYSRNVPNLMMAGRDISVTHVALGTVRVMRTGGMMGEVVGMAASLCKQHGTTPRGVYEDRLEELKALMNEGVSELASPLELDPPAWLADAGANLAPSAVIEVSGSLDLAKYPVANINDGRIDIHDNGLRWVSDRKRPHVVTFTWDQPQTIGAVRIVSGYARDEWSVTDPLAEFFLEYRDGSDWKVIPGASAFGNPKIDWSATFPAIRATQIGLLIDGPASDVSRIWEVEFYGAVVKE